jgi:cytochrome c oxidase cbb3-type subunit 3
MAEEHYDKETIDSKLMIDHEYDGIKELDNPPPAWLMLIFYGTIIWSVFYVFYYHVFYDDSKLPEDLRIYGAQVEEYNDEMAEAAANMPVSTFDESNVSVLNDEKSLAAGMEIYQKSCDACHGAASIGPDLTDDYWIHGATATELFDVVKNGATGAGVMPNFKSQMSNEQIQEVVSYILVKMKGAETANNKGPEGEKHE